MDGMAVRVNCNVSIEELKPHHYQFACPCIYQLIWSTVESEDMCIRNEIGLHSKVI
jgi:hypothetical protein